MTDNAALPDDLMTPEETAAVLRVHVGTLEAWRARREGPPFVKLGAKKRSPIRYSRAAVNAWMLASAKA